MGPCEDLSTPPENQDTRGPARTKGCGDRVHRPRSRVCLLKGCERTFRPQHPLTRYCSEACRQQARRWREWKARRRYRQSPGCKQKRRAQSRRYRERRRAKDRKTPSAGNARVIPMKFFFVLLRPPRMLRPFPADPTITAAALLLPDLPPCPGASSGAGEALARTAPGRDQRSEQECPPSPVMKTCRYRPDILRSLQPSR
jgi:hypothetical protein